MKKGVFDMQIGRLRLGLHARGNSWLSQQIAALTVADGTKPVGVADFEAWRFAIPKLGPELLDEPEFDNGGADWTVTNDNGSTHTVTFPGGTMRYQSTTTSPQLSLSQLDKTEVGKFYKVTLVVTAYNGGRLKTDLFNASTEFPMSTGTHVVYGEAAFTFFNLTRNGINVDWTVDSVSVKEVLLDQLRECTFQEWYDYTSSTPAAETYTNSAGRIVVNEADNTPRRDYSFGASRLLIEDEATNLLVRSQELDNASWSKTRLTVTANATTAPDGTSTADKLVQDSSSSNTHLLTQNAATVVSSVYTISCFMKAAESRYGALYIGNPGKGVVFDLEKGRFFANLISAPNSYTIESAGDGWHRVSITFTAAVTSSSCNIYMCDSSGNITFTGDGASGFYAWGMQCELGSYPTSYIPTTSATVTRPSNTAQDSALINALIQRAACTDVVWTSKQFGATGTLLGGTTNVKRVVCVDSDTVRATQTANLDVDLPVGTTVGPMVAGLGWDGSGRRIFANGASAADANQPGARTASYLARSGTVSSDYGAGLIRRRAIYPALISQASMEALPADDVPGWANGFSMWDDFRRPGAGIGIAPSGHVWTQVAADGAEKITAYIQDGSLVADQRSGATSAAYSAITLPSDAQSVRARISFSGSGASGGAVLIVTSTLGTGSSIAHITGASIHIVFKTTGADIGFFSSGTLSYLTAFNYPDIAADGQEYDVGFDLDGDDFTIYAPDGSSTTRNDSRFTSLLGPHVTWEHFATSGQAWPTFHRVWAK